MFQVMPTVDPRPPDPGSPVQFCYDDKEKILVVGYDDGTVVTFKDDVKILSQKYTPTSSHSDNWSVQFVQNGKLLGSHQPPPSWIYSCSEAGPCPQISPLCLSPGDDNDHENNDHDDDDVQGEVRHEGSDWKRDAEPGGQVK